jgi:hypothetical protein
LGLVKQYTKHFLHMTKRCLERSWIIDWIFHT